MALTTSDMCARTGAHILYCVPPFHPFLPSAGVQKKYVLQHICQSAFYKNVQEKLEKIPLYIWLVCYKVLLLHPLSRTGAAVF